MNQIEKYNKDKYPNDPISNQLDIRDALEIVDKHNEWRRGADTDMVDTTLIGVAIDTCTAWIKTEIQEKGYKQVLADRVASKHGTLADLHQREEYPTCKYCGRTEVCVGGTPEGCFLDIELAKKNQTRTGGLGESGPRN